MSDRRVPVFTKLFVVLCLTFAMVGLWSLRHSVSANDRDDDRRREEVGDDEARIRHGFEIAPVQLNLKGRNRNLVGLGSYLVNAVGGCNDCHTNPPYVSDPHLGLPEGINTTHYLAGGMAFGPFVSRNLTPDGTGKPAGLTLEKFIHIIRTGEDDDKIPPNVPSLQNDLLQVMPWPLYRHMRDHDLHAIYEYLSAIPHAEPGT